MRKLLAVIPLALLATACGAGHANTAPKSPAANPAVTTTTASPYPTGGPTCTQQFSTWSHMYGLTNSEKVANEAKTMGSDAQGIVKGTSTSATREDDAVQLVSTSTKALTQLPPSC